MSVQVLVVSMNQTDHSLLSKMNIRSDVIVGNQCDHNSIEEFTYNGHSAKYLNFAERGVGLNRNNALMRATGDICLLADDDVVYYDSYVETVEKAFADIPQADVIIFNLREEVPQRYVNPKVMKITWKNYLKYGTVRVAFRLPAVKLNAIYFNQCFGGGTEHRHGEDNLFLTDCLKKHLKIYAVPDYIGDLTEERESTCNKAYDAQYFRDQGLLFRLISRRWWKLMCLQDAIRHEKRNKTDWRTAYSLMTQNGEKTP